MNPLNATERLFKQKKKDTLSHEEIFKWNIIFKRLSLLALSSNDCFMKDETALIHGGVDGSELFLNLLNAL